VYTPVDRYIHNAEWEKTFIQEHVEEKKDALLIVAEIDHHIVGTSDLIKGCYGSTRHVAELGMNIVKEHREKGMGTALMSYVLEWAKENMIEKSHSAFSQPISEL